LSNFGLPRRVVTYVRRYNVAARMAALLSIIALTFVVTWLLRRGYFQVVGYPGVFLSAFLSSATLILPAPGMAVVMAMGGVLNPWLVGIVAGAGDALGETTGYLAGLSGQAALPDNERYRQIQRLMHRYGAVVLFVFALVPNPFFDLAGISAGALRYPLRRFLLWTLAGKIGKGIFIAFLGAHMAHIIAPYLP